MTPQEVCRATADLLERPGAWIQAAYAHDAEGREIDPRAPSAVCWCLAGGLDAVSPIGSYAPWAARKLVAVALGIPPDRAYRNTAWNDEEGRTAAEVVAVLRRAAELPTVEAA